MGAMKIFGLLFISSYLFDLIGSTPLSQDTQSEDQIQENDSETQAENYSSIIRSGTPCECLGNKCSCNFKFFTLNPEHLYSGLFSMEYKDDNMIAMFLKAAEGEVSAEYKDLVSGIDIPPLCVRIPHFPVIKFCGVAYDVQLNKDLGLHVCTSVESQALSTTLSSISFDCINLSGQSVSIMEPGTHRPSLVNVHVGKKPKITFANSISIGMIPSNGIPPAIEEDSTESLKIAT